MWIRGLLILTCTGVSFGHGSNDGQKGMGLILLILIGILPGMYALNPNVGATDFGKLATTAALVQTKLDAQVKTAVKGEEAGGEVSAYLKAGAKVNDRTYGAIAALNADIAATIAGKSNFESLSTAERKNLRTSIYLVSNGIGKLAKQGEIKDAGDKALLAG